MFIFTVQAHYYSSGGEGHALNSKRTYRNHLRGWTSRHLNGILSLAADLTLGERSTSAIHDALHEHWSNFEQILEDNIRDVEALGALIRVLVQFDLD